MATSSSVTNWEYGACSWPNNWRKFCTTMCSTPSPMLWPVLECWIYTYTCPSLLCLCPHKLLLCPCWRQKGSLVVEEDDAYQRFWCACTQEFILRKVLMHLQICLHSRQHQHPCPWLAPHLHLWRGLRDSFIQLVSLLKFLGRRYINNYGKVMAQDVVVNLHKVQIWVKGKEKMTIAPMWINKLLSCKLLPSHMVKHAAWCDGMSPASFAVMKHSAAPCSATCSTKIMNVASRQLSCGHLIFVTNNLKK